LKDEHWISGHLRYSCGKFGVYNILGCITDKEHNLEIGETYVYNNMVHQCFQRNSTVYYRQLICGIYGQPDCDKINEVSILFQYFVKQNFLDLPTVESFFEPFEGVPNPNETKSLSALPEGWKIVDANNNPVELSRYQVIVNVLPVDSTLKTSMRSKRFVKRQSNYGIGTFQEEPLNVAEEAKQRQHERIIGVGTGTVDLNSKTYRTAEKNMLPDTVAGTQSAVKWSGKTAVVNQRTVAVGPGTFVFGTSKTGGFFMQKNQN
ncbi:unnamed protein product, partial [Enterobius vermicularis]|uniref:WW domain-containing protein n=1 Tax=Enterobius vermicularis TaxID=51028 RepID=A0A0N4UX47_ENTVE